MDNHITLKEAIHLASIDQIIDLLKKAHVTIGHLDGRHIHVQGYAGHAFFSDFEKKIQKLFEDQVEIEKLENETRSEMLLSWKESVDELIEKHYAESQQEVDDVASKNLLGRIQKSWDSFLNRSYSEKNKRSQLQRIKKVELRETPLNSLDQKKLFSPKD